MASNADSTLVNRNVTVAGRRTSLRLEPAMWDALEEVARREGTTVHRLCTLVEARRRESSLTAAIRVFILGYYRAAATEDGHGNAGHGRVYRDSGIAGDDRLRRRGITRPYRSAARIA